MLVKRLLPYDLGFEFIKGSDNILADYMSYHPLQGYDAPEIPCHFPLSVVRIVTDRTAQVKEDPRVAKLAEVGAGDPWYSSLVIALESGPTSGQVAALHPL